MKNLKQFVMERGLYAFLSFLVPMLVLGMMYARVEVGPSQDYSILASDAYSQYANFFAGFNNMLKEGGSFFYNWYGSLGINNIAFMAYYLNGLFTSLVLFFDNAQIADFVYWLTIIKFGFLGLSFWVYAMNTFKIPYWQQLALSFSYALMSYTLAYSEILMWFDGLIYLPLVVLGINLLLEQKKPVLLFMSYLLVFISNFYMAFMIGIFTFLYFLVRFFTSKKRQIKAFFLYLGTSFLAGGAAMSILLPTTLDIASNGEALSPIRSLLTITTGPLDMFVKSMVGVYDSTKTETIPFIYIGELILIFTLFFFVSSKISRKEKIGYGLLAGFILLSFYVELLDLLWQGLHTPNMFLFRYSFAFSFLLIMLAGYGMERFGQEDTPIVTNIILSLAGVFIGTKLIAPLFGEQYDYLYIQNVLITLFFLVSYLILFNVKRNIQRWQTILMLFLLILEIGINGSLILRGIDLEWVYPDKSIVTEGYEEIQELVEYTKLENSNNFYRMENITAATINESLKYGYSGVNFFSSIRNRHSSQYLADLGFYSAGTNLSIRYENNTLLMDSLLGIKYNITHQKDVLKYDYKAIKKIGDYTLFENSNSLPLGFLTDDYIYQKDAVNSQVKLVNHLAQQEENQPMFTFGEAHLINSQNVNLKEEKKNETTIQTFTPEKEAEDLTFQYQISVPAKTQAYLTIYSISDYTSNGSPYQTIEVNGSSYSSPVGNSGRYLSLGFYEEATELTLDYTIHFFNDEEINKKLEIVQPEAAFLNTEIFEETIQKIKDNSVDLQVSGRKITGNLALTEERVLMTTIPYDKGWKAYIDGEEVDIPTFKDAFLAIPIPKGNHTLELVYFPYGMKLGLGISGGSVLLFTGGLVLQRKKRKKKQGQFKNQLNDSQSAESQVPISDEKTKEQFESTEEEPGVAELTQTRKDADKLDSLVTDFQFEEEQKIQGFSYQVETKNQSSEEE